MKYVFTNIDLNANIFSLFDEDTSTSVQLSRTTTELAYYEPTDPMTKFKFAYTEDHTLLGEYSFTVTITIKDYPYFDYFLAITRDFKLTITSACETTAYTYPVLESVYFYELDSANRKTMEIDSIKDDISWLAINDYARPLHDPNFCEGTSVISEILFAPTEWGAILGGRVMSYLART
jgi:hypothetical protein